MQYVKLSLPTSNPFSSISASTLAETTKRNCALMCVKDKKKKEIYKVQKKTSNAHGNKQKEKRGVRKMLELNWLAKRD